MTYSAEETSTQSGAPVELYTFSYGVITLRYTSREVAFTDTTVSPNAAYSSASIARSAIESTEEEARRALTLTVPRNFAIAELFRTSPPSDAIALTVRRFHRGDTASINTIFVGRVIDCQFEGASAKLTCEPITVSLKRTGLRRLYGRKCPHVLYGDACGLAKTSFDYATTVAAIDGLTLSVAAVDVAFNYAGGFVEWTNDDGNVERRFITAQSSTDLTLMLAFTGIAVSDAVTLYPGCDHIIATCEADFANSANFGGQPYFTQKNPFQGDPVY